MCTKRIGLATGRNHGRSGEEVGDEAHAVLIKINWSRNLREAITLALKIKYAHFDFTYRSNYRKTCRLLSVQ